MPYCSPDLFFDLSEAPFSELFPAEKEVWEALNRLSAFLETFSHQGISCPIPEGVFLENEETITIGEGTVVESGAFLRGPLVIGEGCTIRHGAYLRGGIVTGKKCVIGHATEAKNAIFLNGAQAAHFAYVGDSILGNDVNLGAGVKCANLRLDHQSVVIHGLSGGPCDTGRRKLGAVIGDRAQIGCNAVLSPGTLIGKEAFCYPNLHLRGVIPEKARIKDSLDLTKETI